MSQIKEYGLNGLLALLVVVSILLSYQVWFPSERGSLWRPKEAHVQNSPPAQSAIAPEVHRPERIYVRNKDGQIALLPAGSLAYLRVWSGLNDLLTGMQPLNALAPVDDEVDRTGETITAVLPIPLMLGQWAQLWDWSLSGLPNFSLKVDRVTVHLSKTATVQFSGPTGGVYRVGPLSAAELRRLTELVAEVEPNRFHKYRALTVKDPNVKLAAGLLVPDVADMLDGTVEVRKPEPTEEQARYFPDLSVVRHIEEKDANSYTDGQRWLRVTGSGQLQYVAAPPLGAPPDLVRSRMEAKAWVHGHGGWSQDLVLNEYVQQPGKSLLVYNLQMDGGAFPLETASPVDSNAGAMRLELTLSRDQVASVVKYRRYPEFTPHFGRTRQPIISPEKALQTALAQFPSQFLFEGEVREMHPAHLIWQPDRVNGWRLEPVWVIQVGEKRIYTPAAQTSDLKAFLAGA